MAASFLFLTQIKTKIKVEAVTVIVGDHFEFRSHKWCILSLSLRLKMGFFKVIGFRVLTSLTLHFHWINVIPALYF